MVRVAGLKRRIATGLAVTAASGLEPREVLDAISRRAHELQAEHAAVLPRRGRARRSPRPGISVVRWDQLPAAEQAAAARLLPRPDLPGADPARGRPRAPVPVHLRAVAQPRRRPAQPRDRQASTSPASRCRRCCRACCRGRRRGAPLAVRPARGRHRRAPRPAVPRHGGARAPHVPGHPQRGPGGRGGRRREPAAGPGEGAAAAPVRAAGAAGGAEDIDPHVLRPAGARARRRRAARCTGCPGRWTCAGCSTSSPTSTGPSCTTRRSCPSTHRAARRGRVGAGRATSSPRSASGDVLLHHPYDSFSTSVQAFLEQAAADPRRAGHQADAVPHQRRLPDRRRAHRRRRGGQAGARPRRDQGAVRRAGQHHVGAQARAGRRATSSTASSASRRTASSASSCARRASGLRRYCHVGTGNYNPKTARLYEDLGLLTCDPHVGDDLSRLFNQLSGYAPKTAYRRLLVAPRSLRSGLIDRIEREIAQRRGRACPPASGSR